MSGNPEFVPYRTTFDYVKKRTGKLDEQGFSNWLRTHIVGEPAADSLQYASEKELIERRWRDTGRPYFKLWPDSMDSLSTCRMDFDGCFVKTPFEVFAIMLPSSIGGGRVRNLLVAHASTDDIGLSLAILTGSVESESGLGQGWQARLDVPRGKAIDAIIRESIGGLKADITPESWTATEQSIRIAIGVCMFGSNRHELIAPDIHRKKIERYRRAKACGDTETCERLAAKTGGFTIGREFDLPKPSVAYIGDKSTDSAKREFRHGSIVRAHMRMQACGEGRKDRKLIFIPMHARRPDLPLKAGRGYRIGAE